MTVQNIRGLEFRLSVVRIFQRFVVSFCDPAPTERDYRDHLEHNLKRLAETSPHLLEDIGIRQARLDAGFDQD